MSIQNLRERRNALAVEARKLMDDTRNTQWTNEHQSKYDDLTGQINDIDSRIDREQKLLDLQADEAFKNADHIPDAKKKALENALSDESIFNTWLRHGEKGMNAEQAQKFYNTMSVGTGSQGGYTVPTQVANDLINSLKAFGSMRVVAEILRTSTGQPLSMPTTDGTSEVGELVAENATAASADPTFGTASLAVYKFSSKIVAVPIELLQDSVIDIEAFVQRRLSQRLGRITNQLYTTGTGSSQPMGIVTASGSGTVLGTGNTTTFAYDDLVNLQESIDDAYIAEGKGRFMFSQTVRKALRKLKDTAGRPIWTPGYEYGVTAGIPDQLLGCDVVINNDMAVPAANAKSIIFGDLSRYVIRDSMQVSLFRFTDSAYTTKGQVGFLAWMRSGGNLLDTSAVKFLQHSAT